MFSRLMLVLIIDLCLTASLQPIGAVGNALTVHEWGTFTSVSTADGKAQYWEPLSGPSELPAFVYRAGQDECAKCGLWLARMETPVLYFYPGNQIEVSVNVGFPKGRITEWYPQAERRASNGIAWNNVALLPTKQLSFRVEQRASHYYAARDTDSAPLRAGNANKPELEKFLFYRGTGNFDLPLTVALCADTIQLSVTRNHKVARIILFENRDGRIGWSIHGPLTGSQSFARPAPGESLTSLHLSLQKALVSQGLYEKEAAAMIRTWQDSWFEEGLRAFYIVPRDVTDAILPIEITPQPTEISRVFVGRLEVITPEMEQQIEAALRDFSSGSGEERKAAIKTIQKYGRFAGPVLRRLREAARSSEAWTRIDALTVAARR